MKRKKNLLYAFEFNCIRSHGKMKRPSVIHIGMHTLHIIDCGL